MRKFLDPSRMAKKKKMINFRFGSKAFDTAGKLFVDYGFT